MPKRLRLCLAVLLAVSAACGGRPAPTAGPTLAAPTPTRLPATTVPADTASAPAASAPPATQPPAVGPACGGIDRPAAEIYLRVNQAGYLPNDSKLALALTNQALDGQPFQVRAEADDQAVFNGTLGGDRGAYGAFAHLYELDFSGLAQAGAYWLSVGAAASPCFVVSAGAYAGVIPASLLFFQAQRCGDIGPRLHAVCHREDGVIAAGPNAGQHLDVTGGWHDAGDYLKFLVTTGYATDLLLTAYQRHPAAFADDDGNGLPDVLDEARIGLTWMRQMWDPANGLLYFQVGDVSDHDGWRLPEEDDASRPPRTIWPTDPGLGANLAGKAAAAFALAAALWNDPASGIYDADLAEGFLQNARGLYDYGRARPGAQAGHAPPSDGFYLEVTWQDDMALAAAELYRATGEAGYLADARAYAADGAGEPHGFDWSELGALARYEIAQVDPNYAPTATAQLAVDLAAYQASAAADRFSYAAPYVWGSAESSAGAALTALLYTDLSGDDRYRWLALAQRDYIFGRNPWGVSFVNSIGANWPHHPHHQVADLNGVELVGFWDEGPVDPSVFAGQNITLSGPDRYAAFQSDQAIYHDDVADYVSNEPTISANAAGIALMAWFAPAP
ncbi:MAG: glycoside hydrolase family 9 protein [Anaerolineales bacterium]